MSVKIQTRANKTDSDEIHTVFHGVKRTLTQKKV